MGTVNISLSNDMIDKMDGIIREMGYVSRSELVRSALRDFFIEAELISRLTGQIMAVITTTFNMEMRGASEEINRLQHKYQNLILTMIHNHIGGTCFEVILVRGDSKEIKKFAEELKVKRGVETVKVVVASEVSVPRP